MTGASAGVTGATLLTGLPEGQVLAYLPVTGGLTQVLQPGDHVDAVSTADGSTIAADLVVLRAGDLGGADRAGTGTPAGLGPLTSDNEPGVLVATTPRTASRLAVSRGRQTPGSGVMLTLHRPE